MSISYISNPYVGEINLSDRVGVSLYSTAIKGLLEEIKLVFSQEKAMHFKSEIDKANTKYVWRYICFKFQIRMGNDKDLLEEFSHLTLQDVIVFSKTKWCSTDDKNTIPAKNNTTFTKILA